MKKIVGFIFMLVVSLVISVTTYAADDLGNIIAKVSVDKKKDKKKKKKKKKVKKSKKNKKKKKAKKSRKKNKKVSKDTEQTILKPIKETEEVLDADTTSEEDEKKNLPVVEIKVKSASKIWTNEVDITKINIEQALNELLIGKDGYPSAPDVVIAFYNKYHDDGDLPIHMKTTAGTQSNYLAWFDTPFGEFKFISKDSLTYFDCTVKRKPNFGDHDFNDSLDSLKKIGLDLDITPEQLKNVFDGKLKVRFKAGAVLWGLEYKDYRLAFERLNTKKINFTMADVFKACTKHRLVFTNNFYEKFSKLIDSDLVRTDTDTTSNYTYKSKMEYENLDFDYDKIGVDSILYRDNAEYRETELQIAGNINIDTRVSELAKILDEYTGIDLYTFDTSRIENMLKGDAVQKFSVDLERDLGDSHVEIGVTNNGKYTFQFSIIFTRKY